MAKGNAIEQAVTVNIAPATQARLIDLTGDETSLSADASGNVSLTATGSPVYLRTGK